MKLPSSEPLFSKEWPASTTDAWQTLVSKVEASSGAVGTGGAYQRMLDLIHEAWVDVRELPDEVFESRPGARALTSLWLSDSAYREAFLSQENLALLQAGQGGRLSRFSLTQLIQMYFRVFDGLDECESQLLRVIGELIKRQLVNLAGSRSSHGLDFISVCVSQNWLLDPQSATSLVRKCRKQGVSLDAYAEGLGISGLMGGRFGDVCRSIYYLETLESIPVGESHEVLAELVKPRVCKAPFEGRLRVGHKALEIVIRRVKGDPGKAWQNFVLEIAGDPRVSANSVNFTEWWAPLGQELVQKVRGWLSREDLRLFLRAVEEYGIERNNVPLKRMFPARKKFLEGLFDHGLIKSTFLMLGREAERAIKRILGSDMLSSYGRLGDMRDAAVIYMDCGDFHIIEGSHDFSIWVYMSCPYPALTDYSRKVFSRSDFNHVFPAAYKKNQGKRAFDKFPHYPHRWRNDVINFLAAQGISLDWKMLFTNDDWREYKQRFGMPVVNNNRR
ncbi:EH signature domain-containing protein [Alcanivorax sp. 1008]|uniref:EH signature domain-containing protein n=1 Tax=Alcanivorax sp. 1008 TaxID=2816853 RepID=UPI001DFC6888|nr:hypothetical protein [Alcanivorax sp. 1008]